MRARHLCLAAALALCLRAAGADVRVWQGVLYPPHVPGGAARSQSAFRPVRRDKI